MIFFTPQVIGAFDFNKNEKSPLASCQITNKQRLPFSFRVNTRTPLVTYVTGGLLLVGFRGRGRSWSWTVNLRF